MSVKNVSIYDIDGVHVVSFDYKNIYEKTEHKVVVRTSKKFKQSLKAKIQAYCKSRQK